MSAAKRPWPKIKGRSSRRITERPTNFCTASIIMASVAYPGQTFICLVLGNAVANSRLGENDPRAIRMLLMAELQGPAPDGFWALPRV